MIEIRISDSPDQKFSLILNRRRVTMRVRYNVTTDRWSMDISIDDVPRLVGRRIVGGCDLLEGFNLGIGVIFAHSPTSLPPGRNELPQRLVRLYHASQEEVDAAMAT